MFTQTTCSECGIAMRPRDFKHHNEIAHRGRATVSIEEGDCPLSPMGMVKLAIVLLVGYLVSMHTITCLGLPETLQMGNH